MAQRQNLRRWRITCWGCGGALHLRSSFPRINKEDHNIKCWGCSRTGHVRSNCHQVNQEDPCCTSVTESKKVCSNQKGSAEENGDVRSKRPCSESSKNLSNSLIVKKKLVMIHPVVRQVTMPSTSELDLWSDESVQKDQLADSEIKPIIEFKESSAKSPAGKTLHLSILQRSVTGLFVIAIDIDPKKIELAKHNAKIYDVDKHIDFIVGDFFSIAPKLKADVVFLSPPWGGPTYLKDKDKEITDNIALFVPRNTVINQLVELAGEGNHVEIEQNSLNKKVKTITAYYGQLVSTNSDS
ncbi:trimethylguanosine synthase [Trichonephila clavipes]|nr:trimethylguanosine synthase [Trichonephila clavipes]